MTRSFQSQSILLLFELEITEWAQHKITQFNHPNKLNRENGFQIHYFGYVDCMFARAAHRLQPVSHKQVRSSILTEYFHPMGKYLKKYIYFLIFPMTS